MEIRVCTMAGKKQKDRKEVMQHTPAEPDFEASGQKEVPGEQAQMLEQLQNQNIALQNELRNTQIQFKQMALNQQHAPDPAPDSSKLDEPIKFTRRNIMDIAGEFLQFAKSLGLGSGSQLTPEQIMYMEMGKRMSDKATDKILNSIFNSSELKAMKEKNNDYGVA